jgi:ubiquinone/menaquinone biosynthesis C-methylase UbiE
MNERTEQIRADYAEAAADGTCLCGTDAYDDMDLSFIPEYVRSAKQGCSSPLSDAEVLIKPGDVVLDLGCGAGLDVFLAAKLVGAAGRAIGIDMTPKMLELANRAAPEAAQSLGYENAEFRLAQIENLPLADNSVDTVISNCVVNLSDDKPRVFSEIFRVLKPGGAFVISDVFATMPVPHYIQNDAALISRCIGGASELGSFADIVTDAGFRGLRVMSSGGYTRIDGLDFVSATVSAMKPAVTAGDREHQTMCAAMLAGPLSRAVTDFGTEFRRGVPQPVSGDEAALLKSPAYSDYFRVADTPAALDTDDFTRILPVTGTCKYTGKFVTLAAAFTELEDDDNHIYRRGEPLEICEKTAAVLDFHLYKKLFILVDRAAGRSVDANETDCGDGCCC